MDEVPTLQCRPIGYLRSQQSSKFLTPPQPERALAVVELLPDLHFELALSDLEGFSRIWLVWWFHKNRQWRPKVLPPHGRSGRKGLFATRSPHRPNPLGISAVPLLKIDGRKLFLGEHDLLDGTPILDIKPYIPRFDSFPGERSGWFEGVERQLSGEREYQVSSSPEALQQMDWLVQRYHAHFARRVYWLLELDPMPHRTRRILRLPDGQYRLNCGEWRVFYRVQGSQVLIQRVASRFTLLSLPDAGPEAGLHGDFLSATWGTDSAQPPGHITNP